MHMDIEVIEVTDFKSEVRSDLLGCLEAIAASEAVKSVHTKEGQENLQKFSKNLDKSPKNLIPRFLHVSRN